MRVQLDTITRALVGKIGKLVFYRYRKSDVLIARAYKRRKIDHTNITLKNQSQNLSRLYHSTSDAYRIDLMDYATNRNLETVGEKCIYNAYNVFTIMMYKLKKLHPEIDLKTIDITYIIDNALPIRTISEAVENELLPKVTRYQSLDSWIV